MMRKEGGQPVEFSAEAGMELQGEAHRYFPHLPLGKTVKKTCSALFSFFSFLFWSNFRLFRKVV